MSAYRITGYVFIQKILEKYYILVIYNMHEVQKNAVHAYDAHHIFILCMV